MKLKEILLRIFSVLFICTYMYIVFIGIFNSSEHFYSMNSYVILIGAILLFIIFYFIQKFLSKYKSKTLRNISIISFIVMIILQILFAIVFLVTPSWDYAAVINTAINFTFGNNILPDYFHTLYPNNIGITLLFGYIFKLISMFTENRDVFLYAAIVINIFMINLSIFVLYRFIKKVFGNERATLFSIFMIFVTPFYAYSQIVYTDTMTMIFPIAMFSLFYDYINSNKDNKFIYLIIIGILAGIGTVLKANIVISLIAIIIYILLTNKFIDSIKKSIFILISFLVIMGAHKSIASSHIPIDYDEAGLPYTHWVMMGLSHYGGYNYDDVLFSTELKSSEGKEGTKNANIEIIKQRLKDYGVVGYLKFLNKKISYTWADGTYHTVSKLSRYPVKENQLQKYVIGDEKQGYVYLSQFSHVLVLVSILIGGIASFNKPMEFIKGIQICIFGVFLFLILWETRSRYLVCYLPVLIFGAFYGLDYIYKYIDKYKGYK